MKSLFLFFISLICLSATAQQGKKLEIVHADDLIFDKSTGNNAKRLIGNVVFKQENTFMYCDSAYFYSESNSFDAYQNVKVTEGEEMSLTGDFLNYDGNTKIAKVRVNILLKDGETELRTETLDFYREENYAIYRNGGQIINKKDKVTLTSGLGIYFPDSKGQNFSVSTRPFE